MNYSNITLFRNSYFYPNQNYKIDNIEDFLNSFLSVDKKIFNRQQYWKINGITKEFKLNISQSEIKNIHEFNYARVEMIVDTEEIEYIEWTLYYFITNFEWISRSTIKLTFRLDTLNSFLDGLQFHPKTFIEREHTDRWNYKNYYKTNNSLQVYRNFIYHNEGLNPQKYNSVIRAVDNKEYSFIDYNTYDYLNKINGYEIYSHNIPQNEEFLIEATSYALYFRGGIVWGTEQSETYIVPVFETITNTDQGTTPTSQRYVKRWNNEHSGYITSFIGTLRTKDLTLTSITKVVTIPYPFHESLTDIYNSVNRDDPKADITAYDNEIVSMAEQPEEENAGPIFGDYGGIATLRKAIINYPSKNSFRPIISNHTNIKIKHKEGDTSKESYSFNSLIKKLTISDPIPLDFTDTLKDNLSLSPFKDEEGNNLFNESNILSSEFFNIMFFYAKYNYIFTLDSLIINNNGKDIQYIFTNDTPLLSIRFSASLLPNSAFSFIFTTFSSGSANYDSSPFLLHGGNDSSNYVFTIEDSLEIPLINNDYLNYMRNGFNYDKKLLEIARKERQDNFGLSIGKGLFDTLLHTIRGFFVRGPAGGALGLIGGLGSNITSIISQSHSNYYQTLKEDLEMDKQQAQLKAQSTTLRDGGGRIEQIFLVNPNNKLSFVLQFPHKESLKAINDYFYYYGNKAKYYGIPTHNNRCLFDFLKCKAEFVNRNSLPTQEALADIITRLDSGVCFIHKFNNQWTFDSDYKENIEVALYNIINPTKKNKEKKL